MKKMVLAGALATALIVGGGTSIYMAYAKENTPSPALMMQQNGANVRQMTNQAKFMENETPNFDQMKPYMKKMHPDLSDQQLEDFYKNMHGAGGACSGNSSVDTNQNANSNTNSQSFQGMMGNNL